MYSVYPIAFNLMNKVYTVVSGHVDKNLSRWCSEINTYVTLINSHRGPALCALARAEAAQLAYITARDILNDLQQKELA